MKYRVIVIEDDASCRMLLTAILEQRGYEVLSFSDPCACPLYVDPQCECLHEHACGDFLVTDNRMPKMTGLEFVDRQENRGCKGIIHNKAVISATWNTEELSKAESLGCKVFSKPYDLAQIEQWLDEREKEIPRDRKLVAFDGQP